MTAAPPTAQEARRLEALRHYGVLDTPPEPALDDLTALAAQICDAPMALITLVDEHRQWFKARVGIKMTETPREISFCAHGLEQRDLLIVPDATLDERFAANPLVIGEPGIRFYAGAPLVTPEGAALGALCVMDQVPRTLTSAQEQGLRILARQVMAHLELRRSLAAKIRNEEQLHASELSYRRLFEAAQDGVLILDVATGRIIDANPFLSTLLGFSVREMLGHTVGELSPFKDIESNQAMLERLQHHGYVRYEDLPLETRDGRKIAVEFVSNVYPVGDKNVIQCNIRDITERKKSEERLALLTTCVTHLNDTFMVTEADPIGDPGPRIVFVNEAFERITGYTSAEAMGRSPRFLQGAKTERHVLDEIHQALSRRQPIRRQVVNYKKDGTEFWVDLDIVPIVNAAGKCTHFAAIERDITERRQMAEALRESEAKFRTLFDEAHDAIFLLHDGVYVDCNARGLERFGVARDQLIGQSPARFSPPTQPDGRASQEKATEQIQLALAGKPQSFEWVHQSHDGTPIYSDVGLSRFDLHGEPHLQSIVRDVSERKQEEKERRRMGRQMELLLESAVEGIYGVDLEGRCTFINRAASAMLGHKPEQALGRNMHELVHHHRHDGSAYPLEECPTFRAYRKQEWSHVDDEVFWRADGASFPVEYRTRPIFDGAVVIGAVLTFTDITERKRAEEIMRGVSSRESGRQKGRVFREVWLICALSVLVFVTCFGWGISDESFNYIASHDEGVGTFLDEAIFTLLFFCCGMLVFSYRRWKESQAETVSHQQVTRALGLLHGEMETRVQQRTAELLKANESLHTEITERRRATEQIADQAAFLDKAQDAILVRDLEGKIIFWNKGAERMYGWSREEVLGRDIGELLYTDAKKFKEVHGLAISQGEWHGELQHLTRDRGEITIEARWTLIRDDAGRPKSVLAINTDITEKKKIEAQFMRAQRMESIGTLAGGVAHDLNNILAPIMMSIDILKTISEDPQSTKILETIEISAKRGADIVRQVLSFARGIEGERIEVQPKHLLKDLENIIKDTFPKNIRLQFSVPNDIWTILGDPTQMHQILLNLCVNARDAMPNGGDLVIGVENCELDEHYSAMNLQAKPGRYVKISVTDSGTGMPPGVVDKIFEPFYTTKELNKGTGLGLSTVMAIVKSHDGVINVYSEPGKGTTFTIYLPAMELSSEARRDQAEQATLPRGKGETILVVDDEASILTITSQTLQAFGYRVLTATDGADAIAIYAQHRAEIAVVLTDMMMPVMDGAATIHALVRINPKVKIVAASGLNTTGGAANLSGVGVKHFLTKPYTAGTLLKAIRSVLDEG